MTLTAGALFASLDRTWPAAARSACGPFTLRDGQGGGKRASAATLDGPGGFAPGDISAAEAGMERLGQVPLFMIRPGEEALDEALAARGYRVADPVVVLAGPVATVAGPGPEHMSAFTIWPPLKISDDIWEAAGVGPERRAVMVRVEGPKTVVLSRRSERAAGVAFVALAGRVAMVHALEVLPALRRRGSAVNMLRCAAKWAQENGAEMLVALVRQDNAAARALFTSLMMENVGHYHYRLKSV